MAKHGTLGEYSPSQETWAEYTERLELYFVANDITDEAKKRAILLNACGTATYKLVRNLAAPTKPSELEYAAVLELISNHVAPKPSIILERFRFHSRTQQPGETIAAFMAELRRLSEHCGFGATQKEMLRDRLVCGVANTNIQRKLLAEPDDLTLDKALSTARAMEMAEQNTKALQSTHDQASVAVADVCVVKQTRSRQRTDAKPSVRGEPRCTRCGGRDHEPQDCRCKGLVPFL